MGQRSKKKSKERVSLPPQPARPPNAIERHVRARGALGRAPQQPSARVWGLPASLSPPCAPCGRSGEAHGCWVHAQGMSYGGTGATAWLRPPNIGILTRPHVCRRLDHRSTGSSLKAPGSRRSRRTPPTSPSRQCEARHLLLHAQRSSPRQQSSSAGCCVMLAMHPACLLAPWLHDVVQGEICSRLVTLGQARAVPAATPA